jgi:YVTN family beta-propeller protein
VAVAPNGEAYVALQGGNLVAAINPALGIDALIPVAGPDGVAVSPDGSKVYITGTNGVWVIDTTTNTVSATISVGYNPAGVAVSPDGTKLYITDAGFNPPGNIASVIDTRTNTVIATIPVGIGPIGVSVTPDGSKVLTANNASINVSVIDATTNAVVATIPVPNFAFGSFIGPSPKFAGTPGMANCYGQSIVALVRQFRGLNGAVAALRYLDVAALQSVILAYCGG